MSQRLYIIGNTKYPSVTTILDILDKPGLRYWYGKHGTKKASMLSGKAANIGNRLHKYIELDKKGKGDKYLEKLKKKGKYGRKLWRMVNQFERFKSTYSYKPVDVEKTVYSKRYKYAGTLDGLGTIFIVKKIKQHRHMKIYLVITDWKSSGKIYPEYILQVVAYFFALMEMHPGTRISGICIASFNKEEDYGEPDIKLILNKKKLKKIFKLFLHLKAYYDGRVIL